MSKKKDGKRSIFHLRKTRNGDLKLFVSSPPHFDRANIKERRERESEKGGKKKKQKSNRENIVTPRLNQPERERKSIKRVSLAQEKGLIDLLSTPDFRPGKNIQFQEHFS